MSNLIVFDLDGVITSEAAYWDAAGLTLHELMFSPQYWSLPHDPARAAQPGQPYRPAATARESRRISRAVFPESEIASLKARAINSNWDTCYATVCFHLVDLLALLLPTSYAGDHKGPPRRSTPPSPLLPLRPWDADWLTTLREQLASVHIQPEQIEQQAKGFGYLDAPLFHGYVGLDLIHRLDAFASVMLEIPITGVFTRYSPFWTYCRDIFQEWYLGDDLYRRTYGQAPTQPGKPGCIHFDQPLLPPEQIRATLETLRKQGYSMGIATGRDRQEALLPLKRAGLLDYFDEQRISTYEDVEQAEAAIRARGDQTLLTKPHPFPFMKAAQDERFFIVVGDSTSDIIGGSAAGALTVAVLTGARSEEGRALLERSNPDFILYDMTELPGLLERIDSLATIQHMQFTELEKAERLLQRWFARHMRLVTDEVRLTPRAFSLNSFNGFYRSKGEEYFFKTHVEEHGTLEEYYYAELLHQAGYNVVRPLQTLRESGRQMVIYPVVRWPVMFDLVRAVETGDESAHQQNAAGVTADMLAAAEQEECARLLAIYRATLASSTAGEHARAPIHQLFWHRLTGGRFTSFYSEADLTLPGLAPQLRIPFKELLGYRWRINGATQQHTLGELVAQARDVLRPARAGMTVIGHGDAHFGNVFLEQHGQRGRYLYFDPAFAGRHSPLLDVVKPLFHNVFATWMYFPREVARDLQLSLATRDVTIDIEHNFVLTPVRQAILRVKYEYLLRPLVAELEAREALPADWRATLRLALVCCALLTINLADEDRVPPVICWLALSLAVQLGNKGLQPWGFDL